MDLNFGKWLNFMNIFWSFMFYSYRGANPKIAYNVYPNEVRALYLRLPACSWQVYKLLSSGQVDLA